MRQHVKGFESCEHNAKRLAEIANLFGIPLVATVQTNFGPCPEVLVKAHEILDPKVEPISKKKFSMMTEEVTKKVDEANKKHAVVYGFETHVCIRLTILDLLE